MQCTAYLEMWLEGQPVEFRVECDFDPDWPLTIQSAVIEQKDHDVDILHILSKEHIDSLQGYASDHLQRLAEEKEAAREDYGDWLYEQEKDRRLDQ